MICMIRWREQWCFQITTWDQSITIYGSRRKTFLRPHSIWGLGITSLPFYHLEWQMPQGYLWVWWTGCSASNWTSSSKYSLTIFWFTLRWWRSMTSTCAWYYNVYENTNYMGSCPNALFINRGFTTWGMSSPTKVSPWIQPRLRLLWNGLCR